MGRLSLFTLEGLPEVRHGDDVAHLIIRSLEQQGDALLNGDVVVVTHKIVSKAEGRAIPLATVMPGQEALHYAAKTGRDPRLLELILGESTEVVRYGPGLPFLVRHRLGFVCANAGADCSNSGGGGIVILLPLDPDASAAKIRQALEKRYGVRTGVIIADTQGRPFRKGAQGVAVGVGGILPQYSYVGSHDRDGRELLSSVEAQADELAAAATLLMGQGDENAPAAVIRGFPRALGEGSCRDLVYDARQDLFSR